MELSGLTKNITGATKSEIINLSIVEGGKNLSGGQKRTISIARALIKNPDVLIFDEPTTFLDVQSQELIINFIKSKDDKIIIVVSMTLNWKM